MIKEIKKNSNRQKRSIQDIAYIQYLIKKNGFTQTNIAHELNISAEAVTRSIQGLSTIKKVDNWLKENINLDLQK